MIDPYDLTKPWDQRRMQEWFLFGICVAGKNARQTAGKVERLLTTIRQRMGGKTRQTPFDLVKFAIEKMFLLYTRPDQEMIPLDTHVLKWMKANGYKAPKSTPPPGKKYHELEQQFIAEGKKRGLTPKEWDTQVWQQYAKG